MYTQCNKEQGMNKVRARATEEAWKQTLTPYFGQRDIGGVAKSQTHRVAIAQASRRDEQKHKIRLLQVPSRTRTSDREVLLIQRESDGPRLPGIHTAGGSKVASNHVTITIIK
ncbi:hypothetical protein LIER_34257 [Lithospermum erythrorhizon]|uniref:Uncharacterized protein n=1 Tax=Lithospermum erythrorhizon TaxID=34254 RepID=A0AAV3RZT9_LITER